MKYAPPIGATDPDASYINAQPSAGIQGSPVPAEAIEPPMREIVNVIENAGLTPDENDNSQLLSAITQMINYHASKIYAHGAENIEFEDGSVSDALNALGAAVGCLLYMTGVELIEKYGNIAVLNDLPHTAPAGVYMVTSDQAAELGWSLPSGVTRGNVLHLPYDSGTTNNGVKQVMYAHNSAKICSRGGNCNTGDWTHWRMAGPEVAHCRVGSDGAVSRAYNIASVVRGAVGDYVITYVIPFSAGPSTQATMAAGSSTTAILPYTSNSNATTCTVRTRNASGTMVDASFEFFAAQPTGLRIFSGAAIFRSRASMRNLKVTA